MNKFNSSFNSILSKVLVSTSLNYKDNLSGITKIVKESKRHVKTRRK